MPSEGSKLPEFELTDTNGNLVTSADLVGSKVVLYFYPKDFTPGCEVEACGFRDSRASFNELGVKVYGVSMDSSSSHKAFAEKHGLNFPLLADPEGKLTGALELTDDMEWQGEKFKGAKRTTLVLDEGNNIVKVYENVEPAGHPEEVLEFVKSL